MKDKKIENLIKKEIIRQEETLDLIPSENFPDAEVLKIVGSPLMNKYSEGYPGRRYYPGNMYYDEIELLAQERALAVFGLNPAEWAVNVQPYSGSPANLEVYSALMQIGDTLMGMSLASGGHLTHGHKVNFSGKAWKSAPYSVNPETGLLDYQEIEKIAEDAKPKVIISGLTAYPRTIDFKKFGDIAKKVGAYHLADVSHIVGLIAAGVHPSPFPHADVVMTTTHKSLRGPRGAVIFSRKHLSESIDKAVFPGMQGGPHNNITAAIAYAFGEAAKPAFKKYGAQIVKNAKVLSEELKRRGFALYTGGTDNHLMVIDATAIGLDGSRAEKLLEENGIIANRNSLATDTSPFRPSGVRMGTPALTSRGMKEKEMKMLADFISRVLQKKENILSEVTKLAKKFPLGYKF